MLDAIVAIRMNSATVEQLDKIRRKEPTLPTRAAIVRRIVEEFLKRGKEGL